MKQMNNKKYQFLCVSAMCALLFASCEKVVEFDPGETTPYVTMVSRPICDSLVDVYLSHSRFFLDDNNINTQIDDATVTLDINGTTVAGTYVAEQRGSGRYRINATPQPGDTLTLRATVPGYDDVVMAGTRVPARPQMEIVDYVIDTSDGYLQEWNNRWYRGNYHFKLKIKIKANSPDEYYVVSIKMSQGIDYDDTSSAHWDVRERYLMETVFTVNDPLVNSQDIEDVIDGYDGSFWGDEMLFTSEFFTGGEHEFTIEFDRYNNYEYFQGEEVFLDYAQYPVQITVQSLSKDLYRYMQTTSQQSDLDILFGEPVQVHCNIVGGIGIFGARTIDKSFLPAPRYEDFYHGEYYK